MNKVLGIVLISVLLFSVVGCEASREIQGTEIKSYGLLNQDEAVDGVVYGISVRNAIWSVIALETIVVPVLYFMYYIWVPIGMEVNFQ